MADEDEKRWEKRLKAVVGGGQPGPAQKVGDESPNPLPDNDYSQMQPNVDDNEGSAEAEDEEGGEA